MIVAGSLDGGKNGKTQVARMSQEPQTKTLLSIVLSYLMHLQVC
jgi:hypothetical protein